MCTKATLLIVFVTTSLLSACIFGGSGANDANSNANNANNENNQNNGPDPELCGNGRLDVGETCDGDCGSCPSEGCSIWAQLGSAETCDLECVLNGEQSACNGGDGCCPQGCDEANDSDCSALCGNGVIDPGETCDDDCPAGCPTSPCEPVMQIGDRSTCDIECRLMGPPPEGCCDGELCPFPNICVMGECVGNENCMSDEECELDFGPNAVCVEGLCEPGPEPECFEQRNCLPWQNCEGSFCVDVTSCDDAADMQAYCAFFGFLPGEPVLECFDPDGSGGQCVVYMPFTCFDDSECSPWSACSAATTGDECSAGLCECIVPEVCDKAREPDQWCVFDEGRLDVQCVDGQCV